MFATDGSTEELDGFLILHSLRLEVEGVSDEPIFLALGADAVRRLQDTLERALHKEQRLAQLLEESSMRNLSLRSKK